MNDIELSLMKSIVKWVLVLVVILIIFYSVLSYVIINKICAMEYNETSAPNNNTIPSEGADDNTICCGQFQR